MINKNKLLFFIMAILFFSVMLGACASDNNKKDDEESNSEAGDLKPEQGGDIVIGSTSAPTSLIPLFQSDTASSNISNMIFQGLVTSDESGELTSQLAESWEFSEDDNSWKFHLREDVEWHDGEPFTAEDVVFTYYDVPKSEDYTGPRASYFEIIDSIEAEDDYTVELFLKEPNAPFLIDTAGFGILPKHILGDVPIAEMGKHDFNREPVGTGPFKFEEWKQGQYVYLTANEDFYEGRPYLDSVTMKQVDDSNAMLAQFEAGDIDFIGVSSDDMTSAQALVDSGAAEIETTIKTNWRYISYNQRNPIFQDKKVRKALTHGLDRELIIKEIMHDNGQIAHHSGYVDSWAFNEDVPEFEYDPEKAQELLAEAGWEKNEDGVLVDEEGTPFSFAIKLQQGNTVREKIGEIAQQQWAELGMEIKLNIVEWSAFLEQIKEPNFDFDVHIIGLAPNMDPGMTKYFHTEETGFNRGGYSNPELDKLMEESDKEMDREKRKEMIEEAQYIIADDQPYTFLYYSTNNSMFRPGLHGTSKHPTSSYYDIHKWWME